LVLKAAQMYTSKILNRRDIKSQTWNAFIAANSSDLVYFYSWYLDPLCDSWSAIIIEEKDEWVAVMPLQLKKKYLIHYSLQPLFCKYLGVLFKKEIKSNDSLQKKILNSLIDTIPGFIQYFNYYFHPDFNYFLPYYWKGYTVLPRYSYKLHAGKINFSTRITNHIKKSHKNNLKCLSTESPSAIITLALQRKLLDQASARTFEKLWRSLRENESGMLLVVTDNFKNVHSAAAFAFTGETAYMILSVIAPQYKKLGGNALLITEALKLFNSKGITTFYFEGSMLENVETYITGFQAEKVLYFNITKSKFMLKNLILPIQNKLRTLFY
jgi:hypothetical protein